MSKTTNKTQIIHIEHSSLIYRYAYGLLYRANSRMANNFGSQNLRMTNAIYTNGWLDPMLYHGIPYTQDNDTFTINLYGTMKAMFFYSSNMP